MNEEISRLATLVESGRDRAGKGRGEGALNAAPASVGLSPLTGLAFPPIPPPASALGAPAAASGIGAQLAKAAQEAVNADTPARKRAKTNVTPEAARYVPPISLGLSSTPVYSPVALVRVAALTP